tara:strand:+ start:3795 stop:4739 length:945 start_codon:yes stop_codon:yes gene_type:complete
MICYGACLLNLCLISYQERSRLNLKDIRKYLSNIFEGKRKNAVSLPNDTALSTNLKKLKIGEEDTPVEISTSEVRVNGTINADAVNVDGSAVATKLNDLSDVSYSSGDLTITDLDKIVADDFVVDSGASVELDSHSGNFLAKKAGTEFSAANSAYAGMVLGYTMLRNTTADAGAELISIGTSFATLQTDAGNDVKVTFVAPPSGKVEIVFSALVDATSKVIYFALSDNATYNEYDAIQTYDAKCMTVDETDENVVSIRWYVPLLTAGSSYTFFIGAKVTSGTCNIVQGINRLNNYSPPIIVKAIALPNTIYSGQ